MALFDIFDPKAPPVPVGIDLGTTNSLVAFVRDGKPVCIRDCDGAALLPSVVHFGPALSVVVGGEAARMAASSPRETIVSVKRFMGRGAADPETRRLAPYTFVDPASDEDARVVRFSVRGRSLTPVEVSAEILRALRSRAEDELHSVGGVVITVPAYFDDAQRQATKDAGRIAGLEVLRLLNEPTAAALAYGLEKGKNGTFAVYDLGGGTFDVTVLVLDDGVFQVRSTGGDSALGGDDFDRALALAVLLPAMGCESPEHQTPEIVRMAIDAAKAVKHGLTDRAEVEAILPVRGGGERTTVITREAFEAIIRPLVERTGVACRRALRDAELAPGSLDGVILVGGSTRVPYVRSFVRDLFGKEPLGDIDPDEVVALGAAVLAEQLGGSGSSDDALLLDVLPLSLGIETMGGVVDKILPRNTTIPTAARSTFTTYADNQTGFDLHVVQGEREFAADCRSLARFTLKGIPPMPAGLARLEVSFEVDEDSLLHVSARELTTGIEQKIEVKPTYGLTDEQVEDMLLAALDHGEQDLSSRRLAEERVEAERILLATTKALAADAGLLRPGDREAISAAITALRAACEGSSPGRIHEAIEALDHATHDWAGRRMDAAIARAIEGRSVGDVAATVGAARGVEGRLADERKGAPGLAGEQG
jgi:molecular chaperone HscA